MALQVEHEDVEELAKWGMGLNRIQEDCFFCKKETRFWHRPSNRPVCESCAKTHSEADFPKTAKQVIQEVADDLLDRMKEYGFNPKGAMLTEAIMESANILDHDLSESDIEAVKAIIQKR